MEQGDDRLITRGDPVDRFELPKHAAPGVRRAPEIADLLRLLDGADRSDPEPAPVLKLEATTGMRRGELAVPRRNRLRLGNSELVVDNATNDAGGVVVEKSTKTQRSRVVSIDAATAAMRRDQLAAMDARARLCASLLQPMRSSSVSM